jgi:hypothetical protein
MSEYTCDMCENAIVDHEYFLIIKGVPTTTTVLMCSCDEVKDKYYNRFSRQKKIHVDARNELPPLIGNAHDYCRGLFFKQADKSILDNRDEDEF